jgi:putative aldouronate transport system substrate-binding protein
LKKKVLSILLCIVVIAGSLIGCGGSGNDNDNNGNSEGSVTKGADQAGTEGTAFTYTLPGKYMNWLQDLNYWDDMQKLSGISVELVNGGENDDSYYQNVDLSVGSKNLTDALVVRQSQAAVYQAQGAFIDLKELINEYAPNIKAYIDANPDYASMITATDGAIYGLPAENPLYNNLTFYRSDMLEAAGITTLPTTIDEFTEVLRELKDYYKNETGYYPWVGRDSYLHYAECFGCLDYIDEQGKVHGIYNSSLGNGTGYDIYADGFRDMIEWYHTLYAEGLIDPEWVSGTSTEEDWQTKYLTGKGTICDDYFTRPTWFMSNAEDNPDYQIEVMDLFKTNSGETAHRYQKLVNTDRYLVIPESSKNAVTVIKFLDWLFSEDGQEVMHYGIDGINTTKNTDGTYTWIADFAVEAVKPVGEENIGIYQDRLTFPYPVDNKSYYESLDSKVQSYCIDYFNQYSSYAKQIVYSEEQAEQRSNLMAKYQTQFNSEVLSFVKGETQINDDTWAKFLEDMENVGYSKINEIDQAAYDAMSK